MLLFPFTNCHPCAFHLIVEPLTRLAWHISFNSFVDSQFQNNVYIVNWMPNKIFNAFMFIKPKITNEWMNEWMNYITILFGNLIIIIIKPLSTIPFKYTYFNCQWVWGLGLNIWNIFQQFNLIRMWRRLTITMTKNDRYWFNGG